MQRILLIDDNEEMRSMLGQMIREAGFEVVLAANGNEGIAQYRSAPADLIITSANDITFTDVDGNSTRFCMGTAGGCPGTAGELTRNSQPLATGISALTFSFLTKTGAATAVAANVFYITVAFTATQNTIIKSFQATVSPRNFP